MFFTEFLEDVSCLCVWNFFLIGTLNLEKHDLIICIKHRTAYTFLSRFGFHKHVKIHGIDVYSKLQSK